MRPRHAISLVVLVAMLTLNPSGGPVPTTPAEAMPVREVRAERVTAYVPEDWEVRPMPSRSAASRGIQASADLRRWSTDPRRELGLEAYWVDAARVGLPSDYYYLAAGGPAIERLPRGRVCTRERRHVLADRPPQFDRPRRSRGDYIVTATGTCNARGRMTRWASFVAAPGFGPAKHLGIPESGLYVALVMLPEGPRAGLRAERLLSRIRFGDTAVGELIAAGGQT